MQDLQVVEHNNELYVDSREVAEMIDKNHAHLMRDIQNYENVILQNPKLDSADFFVESSYTSNNNNTYKCYLLTKKRLRHGSK